MERVPDNQPELRAIITRDVIMLVVSSGYYTSRIIPENGLNVEEMRNMSTQLRVNHAWLAEQLIRPESGHVASPDVIAWLQRNRTENGADPEAQIRMPVNRIRDDLAIRHNIIRQPNGTRGIVQVDSVAGDETCVVCLQEKKDDPSLPWAIAAGCTRHKYHRECLEPWRGNHCMTCRAPLERA